ncbi:MAG TPA: hypothetical protein VFQ43_21820 [Nitrososphaera sp.]|nr:hypothetical protein [Nitrososphaera sp.]
MQLNSFENCNLFLLRTATSGWPPGQLQISGDAISEKLQDDVGGIFAMLRLLGTIEYESAFALSGYVEDGHSVCRRFAQTERFNITRGCLPWLIKEEDLETATKLRREYSKLLTKFPQRWRFGRGCHALKVAFEQYYASDRLHGLVRSLEALILPEIGSTEKQFVTRCSMFAGPKSSEGKIRSVLQEVYKMRYDIEHIHDWDRSLQNYPIDDRENIALWRTRQMEELTSSVYKRILLDNSLQKHFFTDSDTLTFWKQPEDVIRQAFGEVCDIAKSKIINKFDVVGRADASLWPREVLKSLSRDARSA